MEQGPVQVLRRVAASPANDDGWAFLVPLEDRPWPDAKAPPHLGGNGDLPLGGHARPSECHTIRLPRYCADLKGRGHAGREGAQRVGPGGTRAFSSSVQFWTSWMCVTGGVGEAGITW
jgi:hypothetical protein